MAYICELEPISICEPDIDGFGNCGDVVSECPNAKYVDEEKKDVQFEYAKTIKENYKLEELDKSKPIEKIYNEVINDWNFFKEVDGEDAWSNRGESYYCVFWIAKKTEYLIENKHLLSDSQYDNIFNIDSDFLQHII